MYSRIAVAVGLALQLSATHLVLAQAGAPTSLNSAVVAQEKMVLEAIASKDTVAFNKALGSDFVYVDANGPIRWQLSKTSTMLPPCVLGTRWSIDNPATSDVGDLVVLTYSSSAEQVCDGKKSPSPVNSMSVWQKRGGKWMAVAHSETPAAPKQ